MHATANRLIAAGHDVSDAAWFAAEKAATLEPGSRFTNLRWEPDTHQPVNELIHEINACADADELMDLAEYIAERLAVAA